jgi:hypothetical protein
MTQQPQTGDVGKLRRRCLWIGAIAAVASVIADYVLSIGDHHATPVPGSRLLGYWPVFAVFWFLVFVFGSKWFGKLGIQKREGYYGEGDA